MKRQWNTATKCSEFRRDSQELEALDQRAVAIGRIVRNDIVQTDRQSGEIELATQMLIVDNFQVNRVGLPSAV